MSYSYLLSRFYVPSSDLKYKVSKTKPCSCGLGFLFCFVLFAVLRFELRAYTLSSKYSTSPFS
jgi:hypothetical protein